MAIKRFGLAPIFGLVTTFGELLGQLFDFRQLRRIARIALAKSIWRALDFQDLWHQFLDFWQLWGNFRDNLLTCNNFWGTLKTIFEGLEGFGEASTFGNFQPTPWKLALTSRASPKVTSPPKVTFQKLPQSYRKFKELTFGYLQ